jgi:hypothetical protein
MMGERAMGHLEMKADFEHSHCAVTGKQMYCATGYSAEEVLMSTVTHLEGQDTIVLSKEDRARIMRLLPRATTRKD